MSFSFANAIARLYKPERDPNRVKRVFREFDEDRGFRQYTTMCRKRCLRHFPESLNSPLITEGIEYLDLLGQHNATELLTRLTSDHQVTSVKKNNTALLGFSDIQCNLRNEIIESLITPQVDQLIASYFGSEYLVLWMTANTTVASTGNDVVSFKWHCDKGPSNHLKLILYLNSTHEHGGNTEFISLDDSKCVANTGYIFGRTRKRTRDVSDLSKLAGKPLQPILTPIEAGSGVLFQPANVLHRGVAPSSGTRYTITLCLLPSPVPWRSALDKGFILNLKKDAKWPKHASDITAALGV